MKRKRRYAKNFMRKSLKASAVLLCLVFSAVFLAYASSSKAQGSLTGGRVKYYTSVEVQKGDSLWSICASHISPEYKNEAEYVREVYRLNNLKSDCITEGAFLVLPYYDSYITCQK